MAEFTLSIADCAVGVKTLFDSTRDYCRDFLTEECALFSIAVTPADLENEQHWLDEEADREGLRRRVFGNPFLERNFLQRRAAALLLQRDTILLHGSAVAMDGRGYLFTAGCGTGKSTHARLWREVLGASAVNDDKPFLRLTPGGVLLCGSPWQGKHGLGCNVTVPLAGICILERGSENRIFPLAPGEALPILIRGCVPDEDRTRQEALLRAIAEAVPLWQLHCTPTPDAAILAHSTMSGRLS